MVAKTKILALQMNYVKTEIDLKASSWIQDLIIKCITKRWNMIKDQEMLNWF